MSNVGNDPQRDIPWTHTILGLLSNHLVLGNVAANLTARDRLALGATSKDFHQLVQHSHGVFRHLDLTAVKTAQFDIPPIDTGAQVWRNVQVDENVTEEDFYSGPLRGIFATLQRRHLLKDVQTLILDNLSVTADLCHDILTDASYNVRILSLRGAKNLNVRGLQGALKNACRPTRPPGTPKLKGLYIFTNPSVPATSLEHSDPWYGEKGRVIQQTVSSDWADTLVDCQGVIAFDAVLCGGPCHLNSSAWSATAAPGPQWAVASFSLPGCASCGCAPEGFTVFNPSADRTHFPLLPDVPLLSSSLKAATSPTPSNAAQAPSFIARCLHCVQERHCRTCNKWWCETCYTPPPQGLPNTASTGESDADAKKIHRSCVECGFNCNDCISRTQKRCASCGGGYCLTHHEGSNSTLCDWCCTRSRRRVPSPRLRPVEPAVPAAKGKLSWANWMRMQNSIGEQRARERGFPREGLRLLAARS